MAWFSRKDKNISPDVVKKDIPGGLWVKCPSCSEIQYKPELEKKVLTSVGIANITLGWLQNSILNF